MIAASVTTASRVMALQAARLPRRRWPASLHSPRLAVEVSFMPGARIEPTAGEIGEEIEQQRQHPVHDHHAHDERVVAVDGALYQVTPASRQTKHRLDDQ